MSAAIPTKVADGLSADGDRAGPPCKGPSLDDKASVDPEGQALVFAGSKP